MTILITFIHPILNRSLIVYHYSYASSHGSIQLMQMLGWIPAHIAIVDDVVRSASFQVRNFHSIPQIYL